MKVSILVGGTLSSLILASTLAAALASAAGRAPQQGVTTVSCSVTTVSIRTRAEYDPGVLAVTPSLQVIFIGTKPTSAQAEAVLRACITAVAAKFVVPREMLANAWFAKVSPSDDDEGPLALLDGSDALVFDPATKRTRTFNERDGMQPATRDSGMYFTVYREEKVIVPPYGKFASLDVVFPTGKVSEGDVYKALVQELEKSVRAQSPRLSTIAYAKSGIKANPAGQTQIRGNDGKYIRVEYDPKDGRIRDRRGTVLGTIR